MVRHADLCAAALGALMLTTPGRAQHTPMPGKWTMGTIQPMPTMQIMRAMANLPLTHPPAQPWKRPRPPKRAAARRGQPTRFGAQR